MTLHKIALLDKVRINTQIKGDSLTTVEANNLKFYVYPETVRELSRIASLLDGNTNQLFSPYRLKLANKTMKRV